MRPAADYKTIYGRMVDLKNLKDVGDQKVVRELKAFCKQFCDINMYRWGVCMYVCMHVKK